MIERMVALAFRQLVHRYPSKLTAAMVLPANITILHSGFAAHSIPITLVGLCGVTGWLAVLLWADNSSASKTARSNTWLPWAAPWRINGTLAIAGALCFAASGGINNRIDEITLSLLNLLGAALLTLTPRHLDAAGTVHRHFNQLARRTWLIIHSNPTRAAAVAYTASALVMLLGGLMTRDLPRAACGAWFILCGLMQGLVQKQASSH